MEAVSYTHLDVYKRQGSIEANEEGFTGVLLHHLGKISEILIFLIGAMTIVELIDLHRGFDIIKEWIGTKNRKKLLWIVGIIGFILSAIIDNPVSYTHLDVYKRQA